MDWNGKLWGAAVHNWAYTGSLCAGWNICHNLPQSFLTFCSASPLSSAVQPLLGWCYSSHCFSLGTISPPTPLRCPAPQRFSPIWRDASPAGGVECLPPYFPHAAAKVTEEAEEAVSERYYASVQQSLMTLHTMSSLASPPQPPGPQFRKHIPIQFLPLRLQTSWRTSSVFFCVGRRWCHGLIYIYIYIYIIYRAV